MRLVHTFMRALFVEGCCWVIQSFSSGELRKIADAPFGGMRLIMSGILVRLMGCAGCCCRGGGGGTADAPFAVVVVVCVGSAGAGVCYSCRCWWLAGGVAIW